MLALVRRDLGRSRRDFLEIEQLRGYMLGREIAEAYGVTVAYVSHIQLGRYKR